MYGQISLEQSSGKLQEQANLPLISIIIAVYNAEETLQRCIDSIIGQTYGHTELIVIDGESIDGTIDVLKANEKHITYWESSPDTGIYDAWNKALKHTHGEWLCFLGADDYLWGAETLAEVSVQLNAAYPPYRVVYGQVALVNGTNDVLYYVGQPWNKVKRKFKSLMVLPHQGVMHHSTLFEDYGMFDTSFKIAGDYDFLLRELREGDALFIPSVIAGMQVGGVSSRPEQSLALLNEIRKVHRKFGDKESFDWWFSFIKVKFRTLLWNILGESKARYLLDVLRVCLGKARYWRKTGDG